MIKFDLIDDTQKIDFDLIDNTKKIDFKLTDYDDSQLKQAIKAIITSIEELQNTKANRNEIPDVSQFITNTVDNLVNYYKKTETYNKTEINDLIGQISSLQFQTAIDLSDYVTVDQLNRAFEEYGDTLLQAFYLKSEINDMFNNLSIPTELQQLISDSTHRTVTDIEKTNWNSKQNAITSSNKLHSDLVDDTNQTNLFVTSEEKTKWNNKSDFSGSYPDLTNNPYILKTNTTNTTIFSLLPQSGKVTYQFLNACNLSAPTKNGTLTIQLAPGNTVTMSTEEVSLVCPGGNYYIYPDETPVTGQTTWSGGYCPTYDDVETMVMNAGGWIIQTSGTATGTVNMAHGQMFKKTRATGVTRLTIKFPDEIDDNYKSRLVLNTASSFSSFTITEPEYDLYFYGDDCANGVLTGVAGKYYDMTARADGFGGVLIEVHSH